MTVPSKNNSKFYFLVTAAALFIVSVIFYIWNYPGHRYTFEFSRIGSDSTNTEVRYLPAKPVQGKIQCYIDELILGPSVQRSRPLFSRGTQVEFCFLRDKILYVGLSLQAIYQDSESENFDKGFELLVHNIQNNFSGIKKVECFVNGIQVGKVSKTETNSL